MYNMVHKGSELKGKKVNALFSKRTERTIETKYLQLDKQAEPADGARIIPIRVITWQMDVCRFPTAKI